MKNFIRLSFICLSWIFCSTALAKANISIVFVLDESGSVSYSNFKLETDGFVRSLNKLPLDGSVEVSVIGFSSGSTVVSNRVLLTPESLPQLKEALLNNPKNSGGTNMSYAISTASSILSTSEANSKVVCLATDGYPNSSSRTIAAAAQIKLEGVKLSPIGIGLRASSKLFLDSIASDPPVPSPSNFVEFGDVVNNACIGEVESAVNIQFSEDIIDFGTNSCEIDKEIIFINASDQSANVIDVSITGIDARNFTLTKVHGMPVKDLGKPYKRILPPGWNSNAFIQFSPDSSPYGFLDDRLYQAKIEILVENGDNPLIYSASLIANQDSTESSSCLSLEVYDAGHVIKNISENGVPLGKGDSKLEPKHFKKLVQGKVQARGLVADGNSRLIVLAKVQGKESGKVQVRISNPDNSLLISPIVTSFDYSPTYDADGTYATQHYSGLIYDSSSSSLELDIHPDGDGNGYAIAIIKARENLDPHLTNGTELSLSSCILKDGLTACKSRELTRKLKEYPAPIVLVHGLWAGPSSWKTEAGWFSSEEKGLAVDLVNEGYTVEIVDHCEGDKSCDYPNHIGPRDLMKPTDKWLYSDIMLACNKYIKNRIACTRADLVGHSMGGLMSKVYINTNIYHKHESNFKQGSVRRFISLSTPYLGSGIANLLRKDEAKLNNCIREEEVEFSPQPEIIALSYTGYQAIDKIVHTMELINKRVKSSSGASAIDDLMINEPKNNYVKAPVHAIYGSVQTDWVSVGVDNLQEMLNSKLEPFTGCSGSDLFSNNMTDGIVPVNSSAWNGYLIPQYTQPVNVEHTGMGLEDDISTRVISLISDDLTSFYVDKKQGK